jgi:two-component system response regulator NreC
LLEGERDIQVVGEASDLETALARVAALRPDVLVLDLKLLNGLAIQTIEQLRETPRQTEVVVMTMEESPLLALRAINAGAAGFVLKDRADSELVTAIRSAERGDEYVSSRVLAGVEALRRASGGNPLSPRETDILCLIALGHTSAEIARMLDLSRRTVETHRARVYEKLELGTRAELVQFALRRHLIG